MREELRSSAPSASTSTPPLSTFTSCIRSIVVWRRPSRLPISAFAPTALTPSVESIDPLPSWSIPRPPIGKVTGGRPARLTVYVPSGPPPCPTTLIAIVAMPFCASLPASIGGAPFFQSVSPCPKIPTGQPPDGGEPVGRKRENWTLFVPWGRGFPVLVPTAGMTLAAG